MAGGARPFGNGRHCQETAKPWTARKIALKASHRLNSSDVLQAQDAIALFQPKRGKPRRRESHRRIQMSAYRVLGLCDASGKFCWMGRTAKLASGGAGESCDWGRVVE
jgi:hypothetical protein